MQKMDYFDLTGRKFTGPELDTHITESLREKVLVLTSALEYVAKNAKSLEAARAIAKAVLKSGRTS